MKLSEGMLSRRTPGIDKKNITHSGRSGICSASSAHQGGNSSVVGGRVIKRKRSKHKLSRQTPALPASPSLSFFV
jgi:hypothetical protein